MRLLKVSISALSTYALAHGPLSEKLNPTPTTQLLTKHTLQILLRPRPRLLPLTFTLIS